MMKLFFRPGMYNHKDGYAGIYVVQGNVKLIQYKEKKERVI